MPTDLTVLWKWNMGLTLNALLKVEVLVRCLEILSA
jgi:hypothetical protein